MKSLVILLFTLLATTLVKGVNLPLQTAARSGTYSTDTEKFEKRKIATAKCSVRKDGNPNAAFKEEKVKGSYDTVGDANNALNNKIQILYSGVNITRTANEYTYADWRGNGSDDPKKTGNDSNEDFSEWKLGNKTATDVTTDPALPCDIPNPAQPDLPQKLVESGDKLTQSTVTTKYFKFSYKISYKLPPPAP